MPIIFCAAAVLAMSLPLLSLFQLGGYRLSPTRRALPALVATPVLALILQVAALAAHAFLEKTFASIVISCASLICACCLSAWLMSSFRKTPPRMTARFVRSCVADVIVGGAVSAAAVFAAHIAWDMDAILVPAVIALSPLWATLAHLIALPVEKLNNVRYLARCRRALKARRGMLTVAVTGSFGKTGVKTYLAAMLSARYRVFATPASYNTPMGICRAVSAMPRDVDVFVVEMGARRRGDIAELCKLTEPDHGLVTGVAAQHLQTFGSIDNVFAAKSELPEYLAAHGGTCCFNVANRLAAEMYSLSGCRRLAAGDWGDCRVECMSLGAEGSKFTLAFSGGDVAVCRTSLIGEANVRNIALAACAAHDLGISAEEIADAVAHLQPAPHRMQPIRTGSMTIIDDSYNCNPDGAANALDALRRFDCKRAVATQGIVEGGKSGAELNERLGRQIAQVADVAIAIGPNAADIVRGIKSADFRGKLYVARDIAEAKELFATVLGGVGALLIQNDLPDNY